MQLDERTPALRIAAIPRTVDAIVAAAVAGRPEEAMAQLAAARQLQAE